MFGERQTTDLSGLPLSVRAPPSREVKEVTSGLYTTWEVNMPISSTAVLYVGPTPSVGVAPGQTVNQTGWPVDDCLFLDPGRLGLT